MVRACARQMLSEELATNALTVSSDSHIAVLADGKKIINFYLKNKLIN
jgi:hypothetical protein